MANKIEVGNIFSINGYTSGSAKVLEVITKDDWGGRHKEVQKELGIKTSAKLIKYAKISSGNDFNSFAFINYMKLSKFKENFTKK